MTQHATMIGVRQGDPHQRFIAGSTAKPCCECGHPTMFSPASLSNPAAAKFMCVNCAFGEGKIDGVTLIAPSKDQVQELVKSGYSEESAALRDQYGKPLRRRR